tara:strand:+ start:78 stop:290 length:213 start_codon:yes stop_codon:yes gene_type:complete
MNKYLEAKSWCLSQGIKIYIVPIQYRKDVYVEVDNNGKITRSPKTYPNQKKASEVIWDLNLHIYESNKHN